MQIKLKPYDMPVFTNFTGKKIVKCNSAGQKERWENLYYWWELKLLKPFGKYNCNSYGFNKYSYP